MRKIITKKAFVAMMLFAFAMLAALASPSSGSSEKQLKEFIENGWDFYIGNNIKDILNNFGKPKSWTKDGPKDGGEISHCVDTYEHRLHYDGLEITIFEGKSKDCLIKKGPYRVVITDNKYKIKYGIKIGSSRESVAKLLGKPHSLENGDALYFIDPEDGIDPGFVKFFFKNNKIYKIEWSRG